MQKKLKVSYIRLTCISIIVVIVILSAPIIIFGHSVSRLVTTSIEEQMRERLENLMPVISGQDVPLDIIQGLLPQSYTFSVVSDIRGFELTPEAMKELSNGQVVSATHAKNSELYHVMSQYKGQYAVITTDVQQTMKTIQKMGFIGVAVSLSVGVVIVLTVAHRIVRPIMHLDSAARHVASGNFNIEVSNIQTGKEVSDLIGSFNYMVRELGKVEILRSNFISDVSHEFKIPLTSISGYAKLLNGSCSDEERQEYTKTIIEESTHLSTLVDNILILNRLENSSIALEPEEVNLAEQIRRTLTVLEPQWHSREINLQLDLPEITIRGYKILLSQVWSNLIDNAIKFSPTGGCVFISLLEESGNVIVSIRDEGCGIDPDRLQRIFDKFYKADASRGSEGNGLGLSIVKQVVEMSGGNVSVSSTPGVGTIFLVKLPLEAF